MKLRGAPLLHIRVDGVVSVHTRQLGIKMVRREGMHLLTQPSLAWVGVFSTRLRRNAAPHQTHATTELSMAIEFFIITSFAVSIMLFTEW